MQEPDVSDKSEDVLTSITLRLVGLNLDPDAITGILGVSPDRGFKLGDAYELEDGRIFHRRNGLWALNQDGDSGDLDSEFKTFGRELRPLLPKLKERALTFRDLPGVERAHLDIFIVATIPPGRSRKRNFSLSPENTRLLAELDIRVDFAVSTFVEGEKAK